MGSHFKTYLFSHPCLTVPCNYINFNSPFHVPQLLARSGNRSFQNVWLIPCFEICSQGLVKVECVNRFPIPFKIKWRLLFFPEGGCKQFGRKVFIVFASVKTAWKVVDCHKRDWKRSDKGWLQIRHSAVWYSRNWRPCLRSSNTASTKLYCWIQGHCSFWCHNCIHSRKCQYFLAFQQLFYVHFHVLLHYLQFVLCL